MPTQKKLANIDRLLMRIHAVRAARRYKYVMMNAPVDKLEEIKAVIPGLSSPDDRAPRHRGLGGCPYRHRRRHLLAD